LQFRGHSWIIVEETGLGHEKTQNGKQNPEIKKEKNGKDKKMSKDGKSKSWLVTTVARLTTSKHHFY